MTLTCRVRAAVFGLVAVLWAAVPAQAQIDPARAEAIFKTAADLCAREGRRTWGISLCGPIVIGDPATRTTVTSEPAPQAPVPNAVGFAHAALPWGGRRWTTLSWPLLPREPGRMQKLLAHELFHRVQPELGLFGPDADNPHLDTVMGRYWLQLEWRALERALDAANPDRRLALADAMSFRQARHAAFAGSQETERRLEVNEGLAQFTGTMVAAGSLPRARDAAIAELRESRQLATFIRTFPYPIGAAYGILSEEANPGWARSFKVTDSLPALAAAAWKASSSGDAGTAAARYDGPALLALEQAGEAERVRRVADLRRRFVEEPVVILPSAGGNAFRTNGMTPLGDDGTVYPVFRALGPWGTLEADQALLSTDRSTIRVPGTAAVDGPRVSGPGWTLQLAPGWTMVPAGREGDLTVRKQSSPHGVTQGAGAVNPSAAGDRHHDHTQKTRARTLVVAGSAIAFSGAIRPRSQRIAS